MINNSANINKSFHLKP